MKPLQRPERLILELLSKRQCVSTTQMAEVLWGADPSGGPDIADKLLHVYMYGLRRFLKHYDLRVVTLEQSYLFSGPALYGMPKEQRPIAQQILANYADLQMAGFPPLALRLETVSG